jgi:spore germination cell wall hydrolase CwlJ-like protein
MSLLQYARIAFVAISLAFPLQIAKSYQTEELLKQTRHTVSDLYCLTKNIYFEARGESYKGKLAVAQVTMNRVQHPSRWADNVCDVVYQRIKGRPQFSWVDMPNLKVLDQKAWNEAKDIAYGVITGSLYISNFTYMHFHNTTVQFAQKFKHSKTIGNHVFY